MKGIGFSQKISYILNRCDVLCCLLVVLRLFYISITQDILYDLVLDLKNYHTAYFINL